MANPVYEKFESQLSAAMDELVTTSAFAELFTTSATNVMAATRLVNGAIDQAVRATRLAARGDVADLARQLARTEDKLERMLVLVEQLQQQVSDLSATTKPVAAQPTTKPATTGTTRPPRRRASP